MYTKITTFRTGCPHARPAIPRVLEPMAEVRLRPELVTDGVLPWADAPQALPGNRTKLVFSRAGREGTRAETPSRARRADCDRVLEAAASARRAHSAEAVDPRGGERYGRSRPVFPAG